MRPSRLLVFALVVVCVHYSTCFIEAPVERISVPETASTRRYWSDPVGRASALYTSLLQVGGQNYRLILVRARCIHAESLTWRFNYVAKIWLVPLLPTLPHYLGAYLTSAFA